MYKEKKRGGMAELQIRCLIWIAIEKDNDNWVLKTRINTERIHNEAATRKERERERESIIFFFLYFFVTKREREGERERERERE